MKVSELIKELQKYDGDLPVICSAEGGHVRVDIDWIKPLDKNEKVTQKIPYFGILLGED